MRQEEAGIPLPARSRDFLHRRLVREDRNRFQETLPFLGGHQDSGGDAIARDLNRLAALFDVPKQFEQRILGPGGGDGDHGWPL
jgi:hypothetical protein